MAESITLRTGALQIDQMSQRQLVALLQSMLLDIKALQNALNTHQHSALNAAPSTGQITTFNTLA